MPMMNWLFFFVISVLILCPAAASEEKKEEVSHSTSVAGMGKLLQLESDFIEQLSLYTDELKHKLKVAQSGLAQLRSESKKTLGQREEYLSNPLNAFSLIRRMNEDWNEWRDFMETPLGWSQVTFIKKHATQLPSKLDVEEACEAIDRLQKVYDLKSSDLATGLINGKQYNASLSVLDTYELGKHFHKRQFYQLAEEWFTETSKSLLNAPSSTRGTDYAKALHFYASAFLKMKYFSISLAVFEQAFLISNTTNEIKSLNIRADIERRLLELSKVTSVPEQKLKVDNYELGCRGQFPTVSNLHCSYNSTNSPFLRLAPLKMELLGLDPYMVVYHDVLTPREISELQMLATPDLKRAMVIDHNTGKYDVVKARTSKSVWLPDDLNALTLRLNKRISDMSGLDMLGSEMFNVMNYGLGGNYDQHHDYINASVHKELTEEYGDRIATIIFYLTDVEQGGATVFPHLKKAVFPRKGTAIIWYNLKNDGEGDSRTLHAACPVIVGSKWVCVKWIREREQLFRRPCYKI